MKPVSAKFSVEEHYNLCKLKLENYSDQDLVEFQANMNRLWMNGYTWELMGAAVIVKNNCSDDKFSDFIHGLIYQGEDIYSKALKDSDFLATVENVIHFFDYELISYLPFKIFDARNDTLDFDSLVERIYDFGRIDGPGGRAWGDKVELKEKLPKLSAKFPNYFSETD